MTTANPTQPKLCYSYIRFSSKQQEKGTSVLRQRGLAEDWCAKNNGVLDTTLNMQDLGVSAYKGKNLEDTAALGMFLKAMESGKVAKGSYLLVENFDRLTRKDVDTAYQLFRQLLLGGVNIVTLQDGRVFTRESLTNFTDIIIAILTMSRAHEEIDRKAHMFRAKWELRRKNLATKKINTNWPHWLELNKDATAFTVIEEKAETIRRIFKEYSSGVGVVTIASTLNREGVPPVSNRSKLWKTNYIQQLLKNRALVGEFVPKKRDGDSNKVVAGLPVKDYFPVVVKPSLFNRVQGLLSKVPVRAKADSDAYTLNLFPRKLFCPYCGEPMFIAYTEQKKKLKDGTVKKYHSKRSLICNSAKNGKCLNISWDFENFERTFLDASDELRLAFKVQSTVGATAATELASLQQTLAKNQKVISAYQKAFEEDPDTPPPAGAMKRWREIEAESKDVAAKITTLEAMVKNLNNANPYADLPDLTKLDAAGRNRLFTIIQNTIDKIYVFFAGSKFNYAKAKSLRAKLLKSGASMVKASYQMRQKLEIEKNRFFVAKLNIPGKSQRLVYPKYENALSEVEDLPEDPQ